MKAISIVALGLLGLGALVFLLVVAAGFYVTVAALGAAALVAAIVAVKLAGYLLADLFWAAVERAWYRAVDAIAPRLRQARYWLADHLVWRRAA